MQSLAPQCTHATLHDTSRCNHPTFRTVCQISCRTSAPCGQRHQQRPHGCPRRPMPVSAAAQQQLSLSGLKPSDRSKAAELKAEIARLAGSQNGNDLAPERHAEIKQLLQQLEAMNPAQQPVDVDLRGTTWRLVYTTSTAASSGKIGPFVGYVQQDFPADQPQSYINWVAFGGSKDSGLFRAKLLADYSTAPDRKDKLNVEFIDTTFMLGPLSFTQKFPAGRGGWWRLTYVDQDYRILYANTEHVFVLAREDPEMYTPGVS